MTLEKLAQPVGGERELSEPAGFRAGTAMERLSRGTYEQFNLKGIETSRKNGVQALESFEKTHIGAELTPESHEELAQIDAESEAAWAQFEEEVAPFVEPEHVAESAELPVEEKPMLRFKAVLGKRIDEPVLATLEQSSTVTEIAEQLDTPETADEAMVETLVKDEAAPPVVEAEAGPPSTPLPALEKASQYSETTRLAEKFGIRGHKAEAFAIRGSRMFPEAVVFEREDTGEKMVRVYRGISAMDENILYQSSYALRTSEGQSVQVSEALRESVRALADNPSYQNLKTYVEQTSPLLNHKQRETLNREFAEAKEGILKGLDLRGTLLFTHLQHQGGMHADRGITPYVSASFDPFEASGYGRGGVMVIDIPLSELDGVSADSTGEVHIKSDINPKYISAVLRRTENRNDRNGPWNADDFNADYNAAFEAVNSAIKTTNYTPEELAQIRAEHIGEQEGKAAAQLLEDQSQLQQERASFMQRRFGKDVDFSTIPDVDPETGEKLDVYTATQRVIFDAFKKRLEAVGRTPEEYSYNKVSIGGVSESYERFDRKNLTDSGLRQLMVRTEDEEHRAKERQARRKQT